MRPNGVRAYLDEGDAYSVATPDDPADDQASAATPVPPQSTVLAAHMAGIPPAIWNATVPPEQQVPVPTPVMTSPAAAAAMNSPAAPTVPSTPRITTPDYATSPYHSALEALRTQIMGDPSRGRPGAPQVTPPKLWQRGLAGVLGGMAGWSNAAGRTRTPIDISAATEGILHPGYSEKMAEYQSRVAPLQQVAQIEGQQFTAQQEAAKNAATMQHLKAQSDYYEGLGRTSWPVTPELEKASGGLFHANTSVPVQAVVEWMKTQTPKQEHMMAVTNPELADWLGVKVNESVPDSIWKEGIATLRARPRVQNEAQTKDIQIKADYASAVGKPPETVSDAEMNAARRMFGSGDPLITAGSRAFVAQNKRLPTPDEETNIINKAIQARRQDVVVVNQSAEPSAPLSNLTGEEFLKTLPTGFAAQVKAIAEGRQNPPTGRGKEQIQLMSAVNQYDPGFNTARAKIRGSFLYGPQSKAILNLNTAVVHLDQLEQMGRALSNGTFVPGNQLWNSIRSMFGAAAPNNFEGLKEAVAGEMSRGLTGTATIPEIANINSTIKAASSPKALAGIVNTNFHTIAAKLNEYGEQYKQGVPNDPSGYSPVLPGARSVFEQRSTPPLPARLSTSDIGQTYRNKQNQRIKITAVNPNDPTKFRFDVQ